MILLGLVITILTRDAQPGRGTDMADIFKLFSDGKKLEQIIERMMPSDPDAPKPTYDFAKCPSEYRGEIIVSMAKLDGFIIGHIGETITVHAHKDRKDEELIDLWFDVLTKYQDEIIVFLEDRDANPRTIH
jgi:hypothetical protein